VLRSTVCAILPARYPSVLSCDVYTWGLLHLIPKGNLHLLHRPWRRPEEESDESCGNGPVAVAVLLAWSHHPSARQQTMKAVASWCM
jgi:hypothetical protein